MSPRSQLRRARKQGFIAVLALLLFAASFALAGSPASAAGRPDDSNGLQRRVAAAQVSASSPGDLAPFNVRIEYPTTGAALREGVFGFGDESSFCNGTLIDPEWVLTAGHCLFRDSRANEQSDPANLQLRVGSTDGTDGFVTTVALRAGAAADDPPHERYDVEVHPRFVSSDGEFRDLALIKLAAPAPEPYSPVRYSLIPPAVGDDIIARGWQAEGSALGPVQPKRALPPQTFTTEVESCVGLGGAPIDSFGNLCVSTSGGETAAGHSGMGWFVGDRLVAVHTASGILTQPLSHIDESGAVGNGGWISSVVPSRIITDVEGTQFVPVAAASGRGGIACLDHSRLPQRADVTVMAGWSSDYGEGEAYLQSITLINHTAEPFDVNTLSLNGHPTMDRGVLEGEWTVDELTLPSRGRTTLTMPTDRDQDNDGRDDNIAYFPATGGVVAMYVGLKAESPIAICTYSLFAAYRLSDAASAPSTIVVAPTHQIFLPIVIGGPGVRAANGTLVEPGAVTISNPSRTTVSVSAIHTNDESVWVEPGEFPACDLDRISRNQIIPPPPSPSIVLAPGQRCNIKLSYIGTGEGDRTVKFFSDAHYRSLVMSSTVANESTYRVQASGSWVATGQHVNAGYSAGDRIEITSNLRTENLTGEAFVSLNYSIGSTKFDVAARSSSVSGTTGWTSRKVGFTLPSGAHSVEPMVVVSGRGTAYADGFTVVNTTTKRDLSTNEGFERVDGALPAEYWKWSTNDAHSAAVIARAAPLRGDVNCDSNVNVVDALFIMQYVVGMRDDVGTCAVSMGTDRINSVSADVNQDTKTDVIDALFIMRCEVGMPNILCPNG